LYISSQYEKFANQQQTRTSGKKIAMTAQIPERIILDGRPHSLHQQPLYPLIERYRLNLKKPHIRNTANHRGYIGTWELRDRSLYLTHLSWQGRDFREAPASEAACRQLFRAAQCSGFPIHAHWFNGILRIAIGRRLIYSHHGWSHWFERERVIRVVAGEIVRDREVDTRAILEWWLRRHPETRDELAGPHRGPLSPLIWFDEDDDDGEADGWPPGSVRSEAAAT
jgi:hypothetical protein